MLAMDSLAQRDTSPLLLVSVPVVTVAVVFGLLGRLLDDRRLGRVGLQPFVPLAPRPE